MRFLCNTIRFACYATRNRNERYAMGMLCYEIWTKPSSQQKKFHSKYMNMYLEVKYLKKINLICNKNICSLKNPHQNQVEIMLYSKLCYTLMNKNLMMCHELLYYSTYMIYQWRVEWYGIKLQFYALL